MKATARCFVKPITAPRAITDNHPTHSCYFSRGLGYSFSILGPINSALYGDHTYLFINATFDFVTSMLLASTYGIGMAAAAGVLFLWQGSIYLFAGVIAPYLTDALMAEITLIGGFLIAASGLSILGIKDCKSMNMLPALIVPPLFFVVSSWL